MLDSGHPGSSRGFKNDLYFYHNLKGEENIGVSLRAQ